MYSPRIAWTESRSSAGEPASLDLTYLRFSAEGNDGGWTQNSWRVEDVLLGGVERRETREFAVRDELLRAGVLGTAIKSGSGDDRRAIACQSPSSFAENEVLRT